MNQWIEYVARARSGYGSFRFENLDYERERLLFMPARDWVCDMGVAGFISRDYVLAEQQADGLRMSLIDEDIPLEQKLIFNSSVFQGGRLNSAILLGMIKYAPALPELREAALHDFSDSMRHECVNAIGSMNEGRVFSGDVMKIIEQDKSLYVRREAAEAMRKIGDTSFSYKFLEQTEEAAKLTSTHFQQYCEGVPDAYNQLSSSHLLYRELLITLFAINPRLGREALQKGLNHSCGAITHEAKSACFFARQWHLVQPYVYAARDIEEAKKCFWENGSGEN